MMAHASRLCHHYKHERDARAISTIKNYVVDLKSSGHPPSSSDSDKSDRYHFPPSKGNFSIPPQKESQPIHLNPTQHFRRGWLIRVVVFGCREG